ncbi:MAG: pyridoxal phosphate-dependent aminotransferase [Bdellovibrionales bacterium]|nr:pyridoxal phosphate-dependent aminotransferase [Bdellovibrionales bacterium]
MMKDAKSLLSSQAKALTPPSLREITLRVEAVSGINLGQGVCQLPTPPFVCEAAKQAVAEGINRYTNPRGLPSLRYALAEKLKHYNSIDADPETQILVSSGTTGAFEAVCAMLLDPGDEVVNFSPYYPYHQNALRRYGADVKLVHLSGPDYLIDPEALNNACSERTKFILINTPANPTGKVFSKEELELIAQTAERCNALIVTDEIYEYMVFGGRKHISPASLPQLADRTITIGGYSKTFAITGWRIGYLVLPPELATKAASLLDSIYVCAPAPLQEAVARGVVEFDDGFYEELCAEYRHKRDLFCEGLVSVGLKPLIPQGSYYVVADFADKFRQYDSKSFVDMMIERARVGAVPSTDFVENSRQEQWVRFCVSVADSILEQAVENLQALSA